MTIGSSNDWCVSEFFRGADLWEFMALVFTEFSELPESMGIGDVLTIPCEKIVHFPDHCYSDVQSIPNLIFWNVTSIKI